jgi:hypothetical protein
MHKASIGVGTLLIVEGAVSLWRYWGIWSMQVGFIFGGMLFILTGVTPVLGGRDQRVIRGLRFGFAGLGIGFLVAGMVMLPAP